MKVFVLGATGMLGHKVLRVLSDRFETIGTVRSRPELLEPVAPNAAGVLSGVEATDIQTIHAAIAAERPDVVVNCIGIVKQLDAAKDPIASIRINSLFPHQLARICEAGNSRLIHVSTDCVFSGRAGGYAEDALPDPVDLYGRSKLLGEIPQPALTIRTSIIGRELRGEHGLVEWFLSQAGGSVRGFRRASFSGWSTDALARALRDVIEFHPELTDLWHVAAEPITKFDLLHLIRDAFHLDVDIEADGTFVCDRTLNGSRFAAVTGIRAPRWPEMIDAIYETSDFYDTLREPHVARR